MLNVNERDKREREREKALISEHTSFRAIQSQ